MPTIAQQAALVIQQLYAAGHGERQASPERSSPDWEQAALRQTVAPAGPPPIPRHDLRCPAPLSPAQRRVWFFQSAAQRHAGVQRV